MALTNLSIKVADRFLIRQAARQVLKAPISRRASRDKAAAKVRAEMTLPVLEAFAFGYNIRTAGIKGLARKLKEIWQAFQSAPEKWEEFKKNLGVKATSKLGLMKELPKKISEVFKKGADILKRVGKKLIKQFPFLEIYFKVVPNLPSVQGYLSELANKYLPAPIKKAMSAAAGKAMSLGKFLDRMVAKSSLLKGAAWPLKAYVFYMIWINVTELSWNVGEIIRGMMGAISFSELIKSLPEAGLGFIVTLLFGALIPGGTIVGAIGWNALLPMALALQIYWLWKKGYIQLASNKIQIMWEKLGVDPTTVQMSGTLAI